MRAPGSAAIVSLVAVVLLAAGGTAGLLLAPEPTPDILAVATDVTVVPVTWQTFDDSRRVNVVPVISSATSLKTGETGQVTRTACTVGGTIESGTSPLTIDDRPVIALATSSPLWRDLARGITGADVRALQDELVRLGYPVTPDGVFGPGTASAVRTLMASVGVIRSTGALPVASVLWLPTPSVTTRVCDGALADTVMPGDTVATSAGALAGLTVPTLPVGATAGDRVLRYGELTATLDPDGQVTSPDFLAAIEASPELAAAKYSDPVGSLSLEYVLAAPLEVAVVPPGALHALVGATGCLTAKDGVHPVTIIASSLGQTFVTLDDGTRPKAVDLTAHDSVAACR